MKWALNDKHLMVNSQERDIKDLVTDWVQFLLLFILGSGPTCVDLFSMNCTVLAVSISHYYD